MSAFIEVSNSNGYIFPGSYDGDLMVYTTEPTQRVLIGCSNTNTCMTFDSNNVTIPNSLIVNGSMQMLNAVKLRGIEITQRVEGTPMNVTNTSVIGFCNESSGPTVRSLGSTSNDYIRFVAGSNTTTELARFNASNGFFGLMTSNPQYTLDVNGTLCTTSNAIFSSNVGIGTTTPATRLHVVGGMRVDTGPITFPTASISTAALNGVLSQWITSGGNDKIYITSCNVGIGLANPLETLAVQGDFSLSNTGSKVVCSVDPSNNLVVSASNLVLGSVANNTAGNISAGNLGMFRNRIINGDMRINQRGTSTPITCNATEQSRFSVDRFKCETNAASGTLTLTQQTLASTDAPFLAGFKNSMRLEATTAVSYATDRYVYFTQAIEGFNISDLNWGQTSGVPVTISCWLRTNAPSNSIISFQLRGGTGANANTTYNAHVTATTSAAWQYVTFIVLAPPTGAAGTAWATDNTAGILLGIACRYNLANGGSPSTAPNTWEVASNRMGTTTAYDVWSNGKYVEITGLQLEKGTIATPFEFRPYAIELQLCQRYLKTLGNTGANSRPRFSTSAAFSTTAFDFPIIWGVPWRAPESLTLTSATTIGTFSIDCSAGVQTPINLSAVTLLGPGGNPNDNDPIVTTLRVTTPTVTQWSAGNIYTSTQVKVFFNNEL